MHVNQMFEKKTGRYLLQFQENVRIKGKTKTRTVETIGYLDELEKLYDNPVAHFKEIAKTRTADQKRTYTIHLDEHYSFDQEYVRADQNSHQTKGEVLAFGMMPLSLIYHELEIDYFMNNRRRYTKARYNHNTIFQLLVYGRILFPCSKIGTWRSRQQLIGKMDFSEHDVYRSFAFFASHKTALLRHLHKRVSALYGRDTSLMYYDVTNYYWETDEDDCFRKRGVSKEHRPEPIVQMGLLMDERGLPISYGLFAGNINDTLTFSPMMGEVDETLEVRNVIYIADKAMMSGDNRVEVLVNKGGYVFSSSVRKANAQTRKFILDDNGYEYSPDETSKYKSRILPVEVQVTDFSTGTKRKLIINERQIVMWSKKYQDKTRYERQQALQKASDHGTAENNHAANKYFKKVVVNKVDGQIVEHKEYVRVLDDDLLSKDEQLDGYYLICTNVVGLQHDEKPFTGSSRFLDDNMIQLNRVVDDRHIIEMYQGLWQIEDTFRLTKSILKARPVYVVNETSIEAHFLSCFVALLVLRILELKTDRSFEMGKMMHDLRNLQLSEDIDDIYRLNNATNIIKRIGEYLDLDMHKIRYTMTELKKMVAKTKKTH